MKKLLLILFALISSFAQGQDNNALSQHHVSLDFGSFRNRYAFAINNLEYASPIFTPVHLRGSIRLRSYGTWFLFSKIAYDVTPIAEVVFASNTQPIYFSAGLGADIRLRILNDERSEAVSSAEPLVSFAANGTIGKFNYKLPIWTRFYSNGISATALPQISWQFNSRWAMLLRYEITLLQVYGGVTHEWRQDDFIGVKYSW